MPGWRYNSHARSPLFFFQAHEMKKKNHRDTPLYGCLLHAMPPRTTDPSSSHIYHMPPSSKYTTIRSFVPHNRQCACRPWTQELQYSHSYKQRERMHSYMRSARQPTTSIAHKTRSTEDRRRNIFLEMPNPNKKMIQLRAILPSNYCGNRRARLIHFAEFLP